MSARYDFIKFLCDNKEKFLDVEKTARGEMIQWQSVEECRVLKLLQSDKATQVLEEMNLASYGIERELTNRPMLNRFYRGIQNDIRVFLSPYKKEEQVKRCFETQREQYVQPIECIFIYFYISENKPELRGRYLFEDIFESAGLSAGLDNLPYMHDAITFHVLDKKLGLEEWIEQQYEWIDNVEVNPGLRLKNFPVKGEPSYKEWYEGIIVPGLEEYENIQATKRSLNLIVEQMKEWSDSADKKATMQLIANTETRRRWYFCKLISKMIEQQEAMGTQGLISLLKSDESMNVSAISKAFNTYFDGNHCEWTPEPCAMARINVRLAEEGDISRHCMSTFTELVKICDTREKPRRMGREFLLMTVLLARVYGVEISKEEYVQQRLLFNCRFGTKFYETNFDQYFLETFDALEGVEDPEQRVEILKDYSAAFEWPYLQKRIAIFNRYLLGKK